MATKKKFPQVIGKLTHEQYLIFTSYKEKNNLNESQAAISLMESFFEQGFHLQPHERINNCIQALKQEAIA